MYVPYANHVATSIIIRDLQKLVPTGWRAFAQSAISRLVKINKLTLDVKPLNIQKQKRYFILLDLIPIHFYCLLFILGLSSDSLGTHKVDGNLVIV